MSFGKKDERLKVSAELQSLLVKTTNQARNRGLIIDLYLNQIWKNLSMHLSSVDSPTVTACLPVSVKSQNATVDAERCSSTPHKDQESGSHHTSF